MNKYAIVGWTVLLGVACGLPTRALLAQDAAKQELKQEETVPKSGSAGGEHKSDQNAKQEGSSKIQGTDPAPGIFVDGRLTVSGAPSDTETVPAKYSPRNAASDRLPIAAFVLKHLTDDQRKAIRTALVPEAQGSGSRALGGFANVGAEVPIVVALENLRPVPETVIGQLPYLKGFSVVQSDGKVLLVNPRTRVVVGVFD